MIIALIILRIALLILSRKKCDCVIFWVSNKFYMAVAILF